jgi:putative transposase
VALLVDGIRVAEHTCVVALGITIDGTKVPLALAEGATENATVVRDLLAGLRERGLDTTRPLLVVLDGAKACAARSPTCSTIPSFNAASCTSSGM